MEDESDGILSRLLGGNLQTATFRMMIYLAAIAAIAATIAKFLVK